MNLLFTKELCMYMIDACDDYFLHHKLLMISKPYYDYCTNNKEQRQYDLICRFQYIEFSAKFAPQKCIYKVNDTIYRIDDNLPTIVHADGTQYWYRNNKIHRDNGPAIIYANGSKYWYQNNQIHRDNGPAVIHSDGRQNWYQHGNFIKSGQ